MEDPELPRVSVKLARPKLPHRPGDKLLGVLQVSDVPLRKRRSVRQLGKFVYNTHEDFTLKNLESISLSIECISIVAVDKGTKTQPLSVACLGSTTFVVERNSSDEFAFEIEIPRQTNVDADEPLVGENLKSSTTKKLHTKFTTEREHPLPPTVPLLQGHRLGSGVIAGIYHSIGVCAFKFHGKETTVPKSRAGVRDMARGRANFWLTQNQPVEDELDRLRSEEAQGQVRIALQSKKLVKGLNISVPKEANPMITYGITFAGPSFFHLGRRTYLIEIRPQIIETNIPGLTASQIPLSLASLSVRLERQWGVRDHRRSPKIKDEVISKEDLLPGGQTLTFEGSPQDLTYIMQQRTFSFEVERKEPTDFSSLNLYVSHIIKLDATFDCAGDKQKVHTEMPVRILSRERLATDEGETDGFVEGPQDVNEDWGLPVTHHLLRELETSALSIVLVGARLATDSTNLALNIASLAGASVSCTIM